MLAIGQAPPAIASPFEFLITAAAVPIPDEKKLASTFSL
jgi:hypothetical protein